RRARSPGTGCEGAGEALETGQERLRGRLPEAAERREPDRRPELADPLSERVGVGTCLELVQECQQARGPLAARRALAARLRRVEGEQRADDLDDGGVGG